MAVLITEAVFKAKTATNENVDWTLVEPYVYVAQETQLKEILGENLYNKMQTDFTNSTLSGAYLTLYNSYVVNFVAFAGMAVVLPHIWVRYAKGNIIKMGSDRGEIVSKEDLTWLIARHNESAQLFGNRMIDYLCANSQNYPEYFTNISGEVMPDSSSRTNRGLSMNLY